MRIYLSKFGSVLISRPSGKEAFAVLQMKLQELSSKEKIELDFVDVNVLTPSWADEFVTPLVNQYKGRVILQNTKNSSVEATLRILKEANDSKV